MTLTVYLADGDTLSIENFDEETTMDMLEEIQNPETGAFATFAMDDALVYVRKWHIVRIDLG